MNNVNNNEVKLRIETLINEYLIDFNLIVKRRTIFNSINFINKDIVNSFYKDLIVYINNINLDDFFYSNLYIFKRTYFLEYGILYNKKLLDFMSETYLIIVNNIKKCISNIKNDSIFLHDDNYIYNSNIKANYSITKNGSIKNNSYDYIDLKILYKDTKYFPSTSEIKRYLESNLTNKKLYIILPLFLSSKSNVFSTNYHGHFKVFYEFSDYYIKIIEIIVSNKKLKEINIVISNIMTFSSYLKWKELIESYTVVNGISNVKIGLMIDEFNIIEEYEQIEKTDFILLNLDYINYNLLNNNINITKEIFDNIFLNELRDIRHYLRVYNIESVIISDNGLSNYIYDKLLIMGFNKFHILRNNEIHLKNALISYKNRRNSLKLV